LLLLVLLLFGLVAVALGMLVMSVSRTTLMSSALNTLILSPTCMLAGCFWPVEFMPPILQRLALFLPQRWVLDAVSLLQEGRPISTILPHLGVIAAFALSLGLLATWRIARSEESGAYV